MSLIKLLLELSKFKISLLSALSALTGFILFTGNLSWKGGLLFTGVFLLASGACALNQYQERDMDILMNRTKVRPVPSGRLKARHALYISLILIFFGLFFLFSDRNAFLISLFILFWYNFVYTPLKRKIFFASIPGALVGALTPAIGWEFGGGSLFDFQIMGITFFFFIWQIPHFWLSLLNNRKDYEKSGFPSIIFLFTEEQLVRITFIWILSTAVACLLITLYTVNSYIVNYFLFFATCLLIWKAVIFLKKKDPGVLFAFRYINIYAALIIFLLTLDRLPGIFSW